LRNSVSATPVWLGAVLKALDAEQRAAATLPDGPAQIIAPAGSGKTATLVARLAVLVARGVRPDRICVVTFNRDAAAELTGRIDRQLGEPATGIEVRTLHALARQVLLDAGDSARLVTDRLPVLRAARRRCEARRDPREPPLPEAAALDPSSPPGRSRAAHPPPPRFRSFTRTPS